jgi:acetylornithine deacetylase/succinyl-diaminopimelate desuccinylase-like protein
LTDDSHAATERSGSTAEIYEYIDREKDRMVSELQEFVRKPSISSEKEEIENFSAYLAQRLEDTGLEVQLVSTKNANPTVFARLEEGNERCLMVYAHYDVQPPDPVYEWTMEPFGGELKEGRIYGRGTVDAKGGLFSWLKAVEAYRKVVNKLPIDLLFLFEGEEEIGSPNMGPILKENSDAFRRKNNGRIEGIVASDGREDPKGAPIVNLGLKGMLFVDMSLQGPEKVVHSMYAPVVDNPMWYLIQALSTMKTIEGTILLEGFYDNIRDPEADEKSLVSAMSPDEDGMLESLGAREFREGVRGTELLMKLVFDPTCNINGVTGGYCGKGAKTIIPSRATASIDFRLVPDQDPDYVFEKLRSHLVKKGFGKIGLQKRSSIQAIKTSSKERVARALIQSTKEAYGMNPHVYPMLGGSNGGLATLHKLLNLPIVGSGPGYIHLCHAPDEYIGIEQYLRGIKLAVSTVSVLSRIV